jgi:NADPH-dependent curcumin reductase CurA
MSESNTAILLRRRPAGMPVAEDFELAGLPVPVPRAGEVLVRARWISLDPYMRGRMSAAASYAKPVEIGAVMEARTVGVVVESRADGFSPGDWVLGGYGWQTFSAVPSAHLFRLDPEEAPVQTALGILGMPGLTAHVGLADIGQPKSGETLVVSAASGAVGAIVGQLGRLAGCRVVGIAGGEAKCRYVVDALGFDACIDHRGDVAAGLDAQCPGGIDIYWENVGGAVQEAVFPRLKDFARMVMCGMISEYNGLPRPGPNLMAAVRKRLRIQGFIVSDSWQRYPQWRALAAPMVRDGRLHYREDVVDGLANAPAAFIGLLQGRNFGKLLVRL